MVRRNSRVAGAVLLSTLIALAVAGCGDSDWDSGTNSGSTKPRGSRAASPPASPSPSVRAADGTNTAACADGNCEIAVSEPVTIRFKGPDGPMKLFVTKVGKNEVGYKVTWGSGAKSGEASGEASGEGFGCTDVLYSGGSSGSCGPMGEPPDRTAGTVVMQLLGQPNGTAILSLAAG